MLDKVQSSFARLRKEDKLKKKKCHSTVKLVTALTLEITPAFSADGSGKLTRCMTGQP